MRSGREAISVIGHVYIATLYMCILDMISPKFKSKVDIGLLAVAVLILIDRKFYSCIPKTIKDGAQYLDSKLKDSAQSLDSKINEGVNKFSESVNFINSKLERVLPSPLSLLPSILFAVPPSVRALSSSKQQPEAQVAIAGNKMK